MPINYDFTGKVALITGSSSGIGAATAILFAKSGANVVVTGRNADAVAKVAKLCTDVSPKQLSALEVVGDITVEVDCNRLIETTVQTFGKIDILVNNAGTGIMSSIDNIDYMKQFSLALKTNLNSLVYMTHKCVPYLAKTRGNVINISSIAAKQALIGMSLYCMSKTAVDMFTKCMAAELGPKRIRVNAILPGTIVTNFLNVFDLSDDVIHKAHDDIGQKYPVGRVGQSQDIANTVAYLASDTVAGFITGTCLVADGGHLAANVTYG
ncbi:3-oxoacyl-[acyl-carrier-protein] reductase FabG-like [Oppia nitens]|uniref:3-oxoacyl-[acyl-carrier-protein] reductase FabG-like n=1 Tax=Oppia nitens TaxID=1686743 RepID=UPI0023DBC834|nr:3-oxoacyl-[acyl-carrier-protein] reductase FabG-like [Oppia nitens]